MPTEGEFDAILLEGISGVWHYHVSSGGKALCGAQRVMGTHAPLSSWGTKPTHMPTSYCKECDRLYKKKACGGHRQDTDGER